MRFERVQKYPDAIIPTRSTELAAGYDFYAAENVLIPSYWDIMSKIREEFDNGLIFDDIIKKYPNLRPTLVSTGVKIYLDSDKKLDIIPRSSTPRKKWMIVANSYGLIDADYVDNPDNEGEIFVQLINLSPVQQMIRKGEKFAQGVITQYFTVDNDTHGGIRKGGFGSTDIIQNDIIMDSHPEWDNGIL